MATTWYKLVMAGCIIVIIIQIVMLVAITEVNSDRDYF